MTASLCPYANTNKYFLYKFLISFVVIKLVVRHLKSNSDIIHILRLFTNFRLLLPFHYELCLEYFCFLPNSVG